MLSSSRCRQEHVRTGLGLGVNVYIDAEDIPTNVSDLTGGHACAYITYNGTMSYCCAAYVPYSLSPSSSDIILRCIDRRMEGLFVRCVFA